MGKNYKPGDRITFRLPKKKDVTEILEFLNQSDNLTEDIIKALEFYVRVKNRDLSESIKDEQILKRDLNRLQEKTIEESEKNTIAITKIDNEVDEEIFVRASDMNKSINVDKTIGTKVIMNVEIDSDDDANEEIFGTIATNKKSNPRDLLLGSIGKIKK